MTAAKFTGLTLTKTVIVKKNIAFWIYIPQFH